VFTHRAVAGEERHCPSSCSWSPRLSSSAEVQEALERVRAAPRLAVLLDYDGTLAPFAPTPELVAAHEEARDSGLLADGIVSGRKLAEVPVRR
jgi:trehalose-6-phosphatase